jgi:23S rRNA (uracil1939-C5)-methyltransferase
MVKGEDKTGLKPPVRLGEPLELVIDNLTHSGEGVGRYQGFTVFVPCALPGERVLAEVISLKPTYCRALLKQVVAAAGCRANPSCPAYADCGACQLQHLDYPTQLQQKRQWVVDALQRIGKLGDVQVHPTLPMAEPWRYRNKAQFPVSLSKGRIVAGAFRQRTHQVIDVEDCIIQHPLNSRILQQVKQLAEQYRQTPYDEGTGQGLLRHVLVRVGFHTEEALAVLVTTAEPFAGKEELAAELMQRVPELVGVVQNINRRRSNVVLGDEMVLLAGRDYLMDELGGLKFRISPGSFWQVNPLQTEVLYATALQYAGLTGQETVIDAYCGIGSISLYLARHARQVIGVEVVAAAVTDARRNAQLNGINNARFFTGEAEQVIPWLYQANGVKADVIVVDPPRAGCDQRLLETIAAMEPQRVVYVSCNPSTLARDLAYLSRNGFAVREVQPVDMFPHTTHVECIVQIKRAETRMG